MNILVAMDSFKGSITSIEANLAVKNGLLQAGGTISVDTLPIADGGEGTVEALVEATEGIYRQKSVTGPLGKAVLARYGILGTRNIAVIEIAEACGLPLVEKGERNPLAATTYGVGELILDAIDYGCRQIIIGLGGSATTDAGLGMLQALGYQFYNQYGELITERGGRALTSIHSIDDSKVPQSVKLCQFDVACDVTNPLFGETGAAYIFGPQKGANNQEVMQLDNGLRQMASVLWDQFTCDVQSIKGAGAAGGLGAAFKGLLHAHLVPGVNLILETTRMDKKLETTDIVITGEGKLDKQTSMGKAPAGIANLAKAHNIPVIVLAGDICNIDSTFHQNGMDAVFSISPGPMPLDLAMDKEITRKNLTRTAEQIGRVIQTVT